MITKASESRYNTVSVLKTGLNKLDEILGGGIPFRKITEISGQWSVGKSTLALMIIAHAQKDGVECLYIDTEASWPNEYAKNLGVNVNELDLLSPESEEESYAETILDMAEEWLKNHKNAVAVLDSVGGLLVRAEAEKSADGKVIGGQAKVVATFCRKIVPILAVNNNALIVLNHQFTDIMTGKLKTAGGEKLGYHKSLWIMLKKSFTRQVTEKASGIRVGDYIEAEVRKNKVFPTVGRKCDLLLIYGRGFSVENDAVEDAINSGKIKKVGQSYYLGEEKIARGMTQLRELFKDETFRKRIG